MRIDDVLLSHMEVEELIAIADGHGFSSKTPLSYWAIRPLYFHGLIQETIKGEIQLTAKGMRVLTHIQAEIARGTYQRRSLRPRGLVADTSGALLEAEQAIRTALPYERTARSQHLRRARERAAQLIDCLLQRRRPGT